MEQSFRKHTLPMPDGQKDYLFTGQLCEQDVVGGLYNIDRGNKFAVYLLEDGRYLLYYAKVTVNGNIYETKTRFFENFKRLELKLWDERAPKSLMEKIGCEVTQELPARKSWEEYKLKEGRNFLRKLFSRLTPEESKHIISKNRLEKLTAPVLSAK